MFSLLKYRLESMRDDVDQLLDKFPAIRIAAQSSLVTLDEYMGIMSQSEVYSMATVLCPYYKLEWFFGQGCEPTRIQELRQMLYRYFAQAYPASTNMSTQSTPTTPITHNSPPRSRWMQTPKPVKSTPIPYIPGQDWVTAYLGSPVVDKASVDRMGGVLSYWINEQKRGSPLARVALDLLTAPASSVDPGRVSCGTRTAANYRQHRMNLSTFCAKTTVGSWYGTPLLPEIDEVVDILNDHEGLDPNPLEL
ncbi:hypothetical protein FRC11_003389 [Ceratobasidium sp. 423]|nr:hypothetical protein FRC11_003389 [Ceratobasidium sp. 423]